MRATAVKALETIGDARAFEPLVALLKDSSGLVRREVPRVLARIGRERAVKALSEALNDSDDDVRAEALAALSSLPNVPMLEPLVKALKDKDTDVRRMAAVRLGNIRDPRAVDSLLAALGDGDPKVQQAVMEALAKIDPKWAETEKGRSVVGQFLAALKSDDWGSRTSAARILAQVATTESVVPLVAGLSDKSSTVREAMVQALQSRVTSLSNVGSSPGLRFKPKMRPFAKGVSSV